MSFLLFGVLHSLQFIFEVVVAVAVCCCLEGGGGVSSMNDGEESKNDIKKLKKKVGFLILPDAFVLSSLLSLDRIRRVLN